MSKSNARPTNVNELFKQVLLQGTLLGNVATAVAVIAVAAIGFMMLTGRINWRYGATVVLGLFVLFGAGSIVGGIRSIAGG